MNSNVDSNEPTVVYYDSDYPSRYFSKYKENFDETTKYQGLYNDVERYRELATQYGGPVLEVCCGSGRVAIPLAQEGFDITCVDIAEAMLKRLAANIQRVDENLSSKINLVQQDASELSLDEKNYTFAFIAFNSLACIPDAKLQLKTLKAIHSHLGRNGCLTVDIVNPLRLKIDGDPIPKPFYTRKNPHNGNTFTRFAMCDAFDTDHRQRLHGWYDEIGGDGQLSRRFYSMFWRPIFRHEIELMLQMSGFEIKQIEGGHSKEPYTAQSPRMFIQAIKIG